MRDREVTPRRLGCVAAVDSHNGEAVRRDFLEMKIDLLAQKYFFKEGKIIINNFKNDWRVTYE